MRISSFSVRNFRSITDTQRLPLERLTALVGRNNEGKSNLLRALVLGMQILTGSGATLPFRRRAPGMRHAGPSTPPQQFIWERDFPKALHESSTRRTTAFDYVFELTESEVEEFKAEVGSNLNGDLPITVEVGKERRPNIKIRKQGRGHQTLNKKIEEIVDFVRDRVRVQYVPSVRTAEHALEIVDFMVAQALQRVESMPQYQAALESIAEIQKPVLDSLSRELGSVLSEFLPDIKNARIEIEQVDRYRALRRISQVLVDDGTETDLHLKGDGVQSLAALALMRRAAQDAAEESMDLMLAIEEPEAHLHPAAAHQLRLLLDEIGKSQQVILTTHSPLFVVRGNPKANVVVNENAAQLAKGMAEIRELLGVKLADNLQSARLVLVVEGMSDRRCLEAILAVRSDLLRKALSSGDLAVDELGGASKLDARLSMYRASAASYFVFLDNDGEGRSASQKAKERAVLLDSQCIFALKQGQQDSELEDLVDVEIYREAISSRWNVELTGPAFRTNRRWSDRMAAVFQRHGQQWNQTVEQQVKLSVADAVVAAADHAIKDECSSPIDNLVRILELRLREE